MEKDVTLKSKGTVTQVLWRCDICVLINCNSASPAIFRLFQKCYQDSQGIFIGLINHTHANYFATYKKYYELICFTHSIYFLTSNRFVENRPLLKTPSTDLILKLYLSSMLENVIKRAIKTIRIVIASTLRLVLGRMHVTIC